MEHMLFPTVDYRAGVIRIIDQTLLPQRESIIDLGNEDEVAESIRSLKVRGAPAIGITAAYGMLISLENMLREQVAEPPEYFFDREKGMSHFPAGGVDAGEIRERLGAVGKMLAGTRPTAVNLFWALDRMDSAVKNGGDEPGGLCRRIAGEAFSIHEEEIDIELEIGENGSKLIRDGMNLLTHCNAGGLATAGYGTALGVICRAHEEGKRFRVYVDETRPLLQGARITAWELDIRGIETVVLCDNAAASLIASSRVDAVIVGADRIAGNGDTANKIGTLGLAVLCGSYGKPFYVAAPWSTFDTGIVSGDGIKIEERAKEEVISFAGKRTAPLGVSAYNPAFDVTPAELITAIISERGVIERPNREKIRRYDGMPYARDGARSRKLRYITLP